MGVQLCRTDLINGSQIGRICATDSNRRAWADQRQVGILNLIFTCRDLLPDREFEFRCEQDAGCAVLLAGRGLSLQDAQEVLLERRK